MFNPIRLELARKRRRMTARILSARAEVAPVTLSRITNGKQSPDERTLIRLAAALSYPKEFFCREEIDGIDVDAASFRSLKAMTATERDAALAAGSLAFELSDWVNDRFNLPPADLLDLSHERDPAAAARIIRQHWAIGEKPMGHFIKFLEAKGVRVFSLAENTKNVDAFSCWRNDEPFIFLNTFKTAERSRYDAAHELGHLILHRHGGPNQRNAEQEANSFASSFLMPRADVLSSIPRVHSLDQIIKAKKRWGVSAAALAYRLNKMALVSEWQYRSFVIQLNRNHSASEPDGMPAEQSHVWKTVLTELWKEGVSRNKIASELNLPLEEIDNLVFGLTSSTDAPPRSEGKPKLRMVE
ncbi:MAG: ImmA/IrrE family metallo-endopeptidase [Alphaproteobacteria bacterium]|nr:ImmA/IrrE family metallo-endopeptidase [Alphaproteobacteria bacterium]